MLDNFAGSGTTGIAAQFRDRNAISIEKEPAFIEIIMTRQKAVDKKLSTAASQNAQ